MTTTKDLSKFTVNTRRENTSCILKDLALKALHPIRLSELSAEKIIEMFVQANPRKL